MVSCPSSHCRVFPSPALRAVSHPICFVLPFLFFTIIISFLSRIWTKKPQILAYYTHRFESNFQVNKLTRFILSFLLVYAFLNYGAIRLSDFTEYFNFDSDKNFNLHRLFMEFIPYFHTPNIKHVIFYLEPFVLFESNNLSFLDQFFSF